jgi:hypothetical protein
MVQHVTTLLPNRKRNVENAGARQPMALEYRGDLRMGKGRPRVLYITGLNEAVSASVKTKQTPLNPSKKHVDCIRSWFPLQPRT